MWKFLVQTLCTPPGCEYEDRGKQCIQITYPETRRRIVFCDLDTNLQLDLVDLSEPAFKVVGTGVGVLAPGSPDGEINMGHGTLSVQNGGSTTLGYAEVSTMTKARKWLTGKLTEDQFFEE